MVICAFIAGIDHPVYGDFYLYREMFSGKQNRESFAMAIADVIIIIFFDASIYTRGWLDDVIMFWHLICTRFFCAISDLRTFLLARLRRWLSR